MSASHLKAFLLHESICMQFLLGPISGLCSSIELSKYAIEIHRPAIGLHSNIELSHCAIAVVSSGPGGPLLCTF